MADTLRTRAISAALDGEGTMPADLTAEEQGFADAALRIRSMVRVVEAAMPPDVTDAVLAELDQGPARRPRPTVLVAAAVFVIAAVISALALRPGGPIAPTAAFADVGERVIAAQRVVTSLDARVTVVERGAHPDIPERRLEGTLRYRAPERLWLHLEQISARPPGWPSNDFDLVVDDGVAWRRGLDNCPVGTQPGCLLAGAQVVTNLPPFAPEWVSPLDLVMPVDAFLPATTTNATRSRDRVILDTTVARVSRLVEGLRSAGAIRDVHATDLVHLELDADTLTLRRLSIVAADNPARANWASTNGYRDRAGSAVLDLIVDVAQLPPNDFPEPSGAARNAGFTEDDIAPSFSPPTGFVAHRAGELQDGGARTRVYAFSDGRAWIRVDTTDEWREPRLFGALGPIVRPVPVGAGVGYTDPAGSKLALHAHDSDVVLSGSVDLDVLIGLAARIATGLPIDPHWEQAQRVTDIPDGALVPAAEYLAVLVDGTLVVAVGGPGDTGFVLTQRPATSLPPPQKSDLVEATARGGPARYAPRLGTLTWLENGWSREITAPGLALDVLEAMADNLVEP